MLTVYGFIIYYILVVRVWCVLRTYTDRHEMPLSDSITLSAPPPTNGLLIVVTLGIPDGFARHIKRIPVGRAKYE